MAASAREDAAGRWPGAAGPARCPQGGQGTGWVRGAAEATQVSRVKELVVDGATARYLSPRPTELGARSRMLSAPLARLFPKSTPGFRGAGAMADAVREARGENESWVAGLGLKAG